MLGFCRTRVFTFLIFEFFEFWFELVGALKLRLLRLCWLLVFIPFKLKNRLYYLLLTLRWCFHHDLLHRHLRHNLLNLWRSISRYLHLRLRKGRPLDFLANSTWLWFIIRGKVVIGFLDDLHLLVEVKIELIRRGDTVDPLLLVFLFHVVLSVSFVPGVNESQEVAQTGEALITVHIPLEVVSVVENVALRERRILCFYDFPESGV